MTISAKVIEDSISHGGKRLTTLQLCYPRFIHSEFMTHRVFSRNAMSSRAVPVAKMIDQVRNNPVMPIHWGKNQAGMQAREELTGHELEQAKMVWLLAAERAANCAESLNKHGLHKQIANRLLEPFQWMHTVVTATEWANFFELRLHPDAEPHIQELARCMKEAMEASQPVQRASHLPYVGEDLRTNDTGLGLMGLMKVSAARCARVSYNKHDGTKPSIDEDLALANQLLTSKHMSPFEHCAIDGAPYLSYANFRGWRSLRDLKEV